MLEVPNDHTTEGDQIHRWPIPDTPGDVPAGDVPAVRVREADGRGRVRYMQLQSERNEQEQDALAELRGTPVEQAARDNVKRQINQGNIDGIDDPEDDADRFEALVDRMLLQGTMDKSLYSAFVRFCIRHIVAIDNFAAPPADDGGDQIELSWDDDVLAEAYGDADDGRVRIVRNLGFHPIQKYHSPLMLADFIANQSTLDDKAAENFGD